MKVNTSFHDNWTNVVRNVQDINVYLFNTVNINLFITFYEYYTFQVFSYHKLVFINPA